MLILLDQLSEWYISTRIMQTGLLLIHWLKIKGIISSLQLLKSDGSRKVQYLARAKI